MLSTSLLYQITFYITLFVIGEDELSGSEGSEMAAELEEKEAIALQQRMAAAISEADFMAPTLPVRNPSFYLSYYELLPYNEPFSYSEP